MQCLPPSYDPLRLLPFTCIVRRGRQLQDGHHDGQVCDHDENDGDDGDDNDDKDDGDNDDGANDDDDDDSDDDDDDKDDGDGDDIHDDDNDDDDDKDDDDGRDDNHDNDDGQVGGQAADGALPRQHQRVRCVMLGPHLLAPDDCLPRWSTLSCRMMM